MNEHRQLPETPGPDTGREKRCGDVVGQVGAQHRRQARKLLRRHRRQIQRHHVALDQGEVVIVRHSLRQHRRQALVQLHRHHLFRPPGQLHRQCADAGAYLQHAAAGNAARRGDILRHVTPDEKVLSQRLGKVKAVPRQQCLYIVPIAQIHRVSPSLHIAAIVPPFPHPRNEKPEKVCLSPCRVP